MPRTRGRERAAAAPPAGVAGVGIAAPVRTFTERLRREGLRMTRQRRAILEAFLEARGHVSLDEVRRRARRTSPSIGFATVYRTMKALVEAGLAAERRFADGLARYEVAYGRGDHEHLVCLECGAVEEFDAAGLEAIRAAAADRAGFAARWHRLEIYGACRACRGR